MKRFILIGCAALALAGCQTVAAPSAPVAVPDASAPVATTPAGQAVPVSKVQEVVAKACGIQPTAATVVRIAGTFTGYGDAADLLAWASDRLALAFCNRTTTGALAPVEDYAALKRKRTVKNKREVVQSVTPEGVPVEGVVVDKAKAKAAAPQ